MANRCGVWSCNGQHYKSNEPKKSFWHFLLIQPSEQSSDGPTLGDEYRRIGIMHVRDDHLDGDEFGGLQDKSDAGETPFGCPEDGRHESPRSYLWSVGVGQ
jgi:hypothetical protein